MLATLPSAGVVAASPHVDGQLPPLALVVAVHGPADSAEPVTVTASWHPRLAATLAACGATRTGTTRWKADAAARRRALAVCAPRWQRPGTHSHLRATGTGITLTLDPGACPPPVRPLLAQFGTPAPVAATTAHQLVAAARKAGIPVLRAAQQRPMAAVDAVADHTITATTVPGMPAMVTLTAGPRVSTTVPACLTVAELAGFRVRPPDRLVVRDDTRDAVATTTATPVLLPGLRPWQAQFAGRYAATTRGLVNALPPGAGKTAAAIAGLRVHHERQGRSISLVVAPATSRTQWLAEAARFFPAARVWDAGTGAALLDALTAIEKNVASDDGTQLGAPHVVVTTPDLVARHQDRLCAPNGSRLHWDGLVVDEATALARPGTTRHESLWAVRRNADKAVVLTGTPTARHVGQLEHLLCFAVGDPDLFADLSLLAAADTPALERVTPYLFTADTPAPAADAPATEQVVPLLEPTELDLLVDRCARARLAAAASSPSPATAVPRELAAARLGAADPQALLASKHALARDVRAAAEVEPGGARLDGPGGKVRAVTAAALEHVSGGAQVLVVGDFLDPLEKVATAVAGALGPDAVASVTSQVARRQQERALAQFRSGAVKVLLLSAAAHLGLNLQQASVVIHLDVPDTGAALTQRTARSARMGSTHTQVLSVLPVLTGSIEDRLADLVGARGLRPADQRNLAAFARRCLTAPLRVPQAS